MGNVLPLPAEQGVGRKSGYQESKQDIANSAIMHLARCMEKRPELRQLNAFASGFLVAVVQQHNKGPIGNSGGKGERDGMSSHQYIIQCIGIIY